MIHFLTIFILAVSGFASSNAFAQGTGHTGGDVCEMRMGVIKAHLLQWLKSGGARYLDFSSLKVDQETYEKKMSSVLTDQTIEISCPNANDPRLQGKDKDFVSIGVNQVSKTCINGFNKKTHHYEIRCDFDRFYRAGKIEDQYGVIHHEYASLAKLEVSQASQSKYDLSLVMISKQIQDLLKYDFDEAGALRAPKVKGAGKDSRAFRYLLSEIGMANSLNYDHLEKLLQFFSVEQIVLYQNLRNFIRGRSLIILHEISENWDSDMSSIRFEIVDATSHRRIIQVDVSWFDPSDPRAMFGHDDDPPRYGFEIVK